jgi:hypothetical protein
MRRLVRLAAAAALVVWLVRKRRSAGQAPPERVTIRFDDGSVTTLETGSPERELLLAAAAEVV